MTSSLELIVAFLEKQFYFLLRFYYHFKL